MFPVDKIDVSDERKALDHFDKPDDNKTDKTSGKSEKSEDNEEKTEDVDDEVEDKKEDNEDDEGETDEKEEKLEDDDEDDDDIAAEIENDNLYQQLKERDAKLLKDIPELKHAIFRERAYTEIFPTVDDAREAAEGYQVFQDFQNDIQSGNSEKLIAALGETSKESLESFVGNLLPTIEKQSKDLYLEMLYPEFKKLFRAAVRSTDENLKNAAYHLHNFVFGDIDVARDAGLEIKKRSDPKADELTKREREFEERQVKSFSKDVELVAVGKAKRIIGRAFENSDISELLQRNLTDEIYKRVDAEIMKDPRHMGNMNNLWRQAKANGFTSEWKDRITNAYLSRAKLLIPKVRQKVLSEAKLSVKEGQRLDEKRPTRISSSNATSSAGQLKPGQKVDAKKVDWSKTDERAALDGKLVYKK